MRVACNLAFLVVGLIVTIQHALAEDWTPESCPASCICHQVWSDNLRRRLNAVDCENRDIYTLEVIPEGVEALLLAGNNIKIDTLPPCNLSSIQYLDLSNNQLKIHDIDWLQRLFTQLPSIKALDLSNNRLESLISTLFTGLTTLNYLSLSGNDIVFIERNTFTPLVNIKTLKLDSNHLRKIDNTWFTNVAAQLRILDLSSNRIEVIDKMDLSTVRLLESLDLSDNRIMEIDSLSFTNNTIRELYMNHNQLTQFPTKALQCLRNLTILRLNANPIMTLRENDISNLPSLVQISLSDMPNLETVQSSAFTNLPQLQRVDIDQNSKLVYLDGTAFRNCSKVKFLYIHTCGLRALDEVLLDYLPSLDELSFYDNPVHCNCLAEWITQSNLTLIDGERIKCASPHALQDLTLMSLTEDQINSDCSPVVLDMNFEHIVEYGTEAMLTCNAIGQNSIKWRTPTRKEIHNTTLVFQSANHDNSGLYTCIATSKDNQSDSESTYIRVVHTLISFHATKISQSFIDLSWNSTVGSKSISYIKPDGKEVTISIPDGPTEINIENLQSNTHYAFCLSYHHNEERVCVAAKTLALQREDIEDIKNATPLKDRDGDVATKTIIIALVTASLLLVAVGVALVSYKKCQRYNKAKLMYKRYRSENSLLSSASHIKLDQCYNPTTEPLRVDEPT